jgi:hypothetical protein
MTTERMNFEMTEADLDELLQACRSVPLIALQCGSPPSPQENANAAWDRLGEKMGFYGSTVKPTGKNNRFFNAIPKEKKP